MADRLELFRLIGTGKGLNVSYPARSVAGPMGYRELEFFEASAGERELPKVSF